VGVEGVAQRRGGFPCACLVAFLPHVLGVFSVCFHNENKKREVSRYLFEGVLIAI
jgi:hypothetical protein